ncbi:MAG: hypothetical protein IJM30_06320 [Thermoguttaceae bacterium]|nr:hypothetical protein [Thermoguttaceae bacterium]
MTLIILALIAAILVALNCFYNVRGLFSLVLGGRYAKSEDLQFSIRKYKEENYLFGDEDF